MIWKMFIRRVRLVPIITRRPLVYFTRYSTASFAGVSLFLEQTERQFCFILVLPSSCAVLYYMRDDELFRHS